MAEVRRFQASRLQFKDFCFPSTESRERGDRALPRHHLCVTEQHINNDYRAQHTHWSELSATSAFRPPETTKGHG